MPARERPKKRVLNRWSDDLDKSVLLCTQYACVEAGLKIPWARVAALMGPTFTEGSIVQHLSKLRGLMIKAEMPVPPPIKRGMVTKEPSKIYTNAGNNVEVEQVAPMYPEAPNVGEGEEKVSLYDKPKRSRKKKVPAEEEEAVKKEAKTKAKGKGKAKGRRNHANDEEDDNEPVPDLYDSDDEYHAPKKRRSGKRKPKKEALAEASAAIPDEAIPATATPIKVPVADKDADVKLEEEALGSPARRTRGIKRDYSVMAALSDDEAEEEVEVDEEILQDMDEGFEGDHGDIDVDGENAASATDDDMDEASSEMSTVVLGRQGATSSNGFDPLAQQNVADLPYGQIISTFDAHPTTAPFTYLNTPYTGSYGTHGHVGVGMINPYSVPELGYSGAATMSTMPQAFPASQFPSMSLYNSSVDSSRNNSVGGDMMFATLPSMANDEFLTAHTGFGHGNTGDVMNAQGMMNEEDINNMANDNLFWDAGDYLVDDA
ncbi:uncharacterized protein Z520_04849 [Fonsecaea multimorphosa CBS 102226]|uniref:Myb-like domain-containing protein n=1 Tax=Fonsecaea multimorphosa CBS 102226 TaxID=1442371 RepID=A0A0D2KRC8_9EURO|nr:uncharacterized protein Z520_04849 [Fonsecaea multimorphosa CBS 102226]KIX99273.1 hypothetical protein Z520_04849 [Fonsecaea multimorphosa CBS 102226]OAL25963.1 hypothetical protein AYO22_04590 [Fonsecaea multimorphosa]